MAQSTESRVAAKLPGVKLRRLPQQLSTQLSDVGTKEADFEQDEPEVNVPTSPEDALLPPSTRAVLNRLQNLVEFRRRQDQPNDLQFFLACKETMSPWSRRVNYKKSNALSM